MHSESLQPAEQGEQKLPQPIAIQSPEPLPRALLERVRDRPNLLSRILAPWGQNELFGNVPWRFLTLDTQ